MTDAAAESKASAETLEAVAYSLTFANDPLRSGMGTHTVREYFVGTPYNLIINLGVHSSGRVLWYPTKPTIHTFFASAPRLDKCPIFLGDNAIEKVKREDGTLGPPQLPSETVRVSKAWIEACLSVVKLQEELLAAEKAAVSLAPAGAITKDELLDAY
jgi:hypothetical protein